MNAPGTFASAVQLLLGGDPALWEIVSLSLRVSLSSALLAALIGLPLGAALALTRFPGRSLIVVTLNALMGMPPVVLGLVVFLLLARTGPFGVLGLLYSPTAMVVAQTLLVTPIVASLSQDTFSTLWARCGELMHSLGKSRVAVMRTLLEEGRTELVTVWLVAFGRAISEIGAVMIVGGNIEHYTRVMTTAIALETSKGNLAFAVALGVVLLIVAFGVNAVAHLFGRWHAWWTTS